jgi:hypothetical protein
MQGLISRASANFKAKHGWLIDLLADYYCLYYPQFGRLGMAMATLSLLFAHAADAGR